VPGDVELRGHDVPDDEADTHSAHPPENSDVCVKLRTAANVQLLSLLERLVKGRLGRQVHGGGTTADESQSASNHHRVAK
jgi:hypothetical protein